MMSCIHYITQNSTAAKLGSHTGRAGFYCSNRWREKERERERGGGGRERQKEAKKTD